MQCGAAADDGCHPRPRRQPNGAKKASSTCGWRVMWLSHYEWLEEGRRGEKGKGLLEWKWDCEVG